MKVRIIATGEIVEAKHGLSVAGNNVYLVESIMYQPEELEPAEPDWQQIRIQAAIAAMQGIISNERQLKLLVEEGDIKSASELRQSLSETSVMIADELIAELKEGGSNG